MSHRCDASTRLGPCMHLVKVVGAHCWQHGGRTAAFRLGQEQAWAMGCHVVEGPPDHWRCLTHPSDRWDVAECLGVPLSCNIPLEPATQEALARRADDWQTIRLLLNGTSMRVPLLLAKNPACPGPILLQLAAAPTHAIRVASLRNRNFPPDQLSSHLSRNLSYLELRAIVLHRRCPPNVLVASIQRATAAGLSGRQVHDLRDLAAHHPNADASTVATLWSM